MNSNLNNLLSDVGKIKKAFKRLNYRINVLYDTQWEEKVTNGYQKWRFDSDGGLKLVKEQLKQLKYRCPVCYAPLSEKSATVDHLRPKSKYLGAAVDSNNMLVMCHSCNAAKNNQEFEAWYSKLPTLWKDRLKQAISEIHGTVKLFELLPDIGNDKR